MLWSIQNFDSKQPPPSSEKAPTTYEYRDTRSAFGGSFERIMQFQATDTQPFFMRFGFFAAPFMHPILAMGSVSGKVYLWDLYMIEKFGRGAGTTSCIEKGTPVDPGIGSVGGNSANSGGRTLHGKVTIKKDDLSELFGTIKPHHVLEIPKVKSTIRHIGFSPDGVYMVVVGENSNITICRR